MASVPVLGLNGAVPEGVVIRSLLWTFSLSPENNMKTEESAEKGD